MKSGFLSELKVTLKDESCVWVVDHPLSYWSEQSGLIIVPVGFETDLASVPRVPVIYENWGNRAHREAVLHDYLYRMDSEPVVLFMKANRIFLEAMKSRGVSWWIRWPMFLGVCAGGWWSYHKLFVKSKLC